MSASLPRPSPAEVVAPVWPGAEPIVIVGNGPAGVRAAEELLRRDPARAIVLYGDEPWEPYQRVRLSALLGGEIDWAAIDNRPRLPGGHRVIERYHCAVVAIQRVRRRIRDARGREQPYAKLILATGSRPHVPQIPGIKRPGVYTFRDLNDVQRLMARRVRTRRTVVLGGGLLGIEAARALARHATAVTLVQHATRLMNRQLDDTAAEWLRRHVESLGIRVVLEDRVRAVLGEHDVERVQLQSGKTLDCDTVVVATGIRPNTELAFAAGLSIGWGVRVNDQLQTSDPDIYAVGECAEHRGRVIGLVAPAQEQAAVVAHNLTGGRALYEGSIAATHLKVVGLPVFSVGETGDDENPLEHRFLTYTRAQDGIYRRLIVHRRRLVGAVAIGASSELAALQEAVTHRRRLSLAAQLRFRRHGRLWAEAGEDGVALWPAAATVCNCASVSRGRLTDAVARGCRSVDCLGEATGAGRVCGSCRPLLAELVGTQAQPAASPGRGALLGATLATLLVLVAFYWPGPIAPPSSAQAGDWPQRLWTDGVWKQVSGYTLLALGLIGLALSLRKRWARVAFGDFGWWRVAHVALGLAALTVLVTHTGLHLGNNLNFYLLVSFLALTKLGSVASAVVALEARPTRASRRLKAVTTWAHILLVWPLPALLTFHVLSVYYF